MEESLEDIPPDIIRAKGIVYWDDPENPMVLFNLVGKWIDLDAFFKKEDDQLETRLVFIGNPGWEKKYNIESRLNRSLVLHC